MGQKESDIVVKLTQIYRPSAPKDGPARYVLSNGKVFPAVDLRPEAINPLSRVRLEQHLSGVSRREEKERAEALDPETALLAKMDELLFRHDPEAIRKVKECLGEAPLHFERRMMRTLRRKMRQSLQ